MIKSGINLWIKDWLFNSNKEPNNGCIHLWLSRQCVEYVLEKSVGDKVYNAL